MQFSKTTAKPLTTMWHDLVAETGYDYWREYILGNTEEQPLPRPWTELTNDEIDELALRAYKKYHARPFFLLRHTLKVRSWSEFAGSSSPSSRWCFGRKASPRPTTPSAAMARTRASWIGTRRSPNGANRFRRSTRSTSSDTAF